MAESNNGILIFPEDGWFSTNDIIQETEDDILLKIKPGLLLCQ